MTNDIREKAEALIALIERALHKAHTEPTEPFYLQAIENLISKPAFKNLKAALRPSRQEIASYLTDYNKWRRGGDNEMPEPKELGYYIECAIEELKK